MAGPVDPHVLFQRVKALWPQRLVLGNNPFQALNDIYWPLEDSIGHDDEWLSLGAWAFHQSICECVDNAELSDCSLDIDDVPFLVFDRNMRKNLSDDSWSEERADYGASLH